jgi:hypothetical protein
MEESRGFPDIVPKRAQAGAAVMVLFAMAFGYAALLLTIMLGVGLAMALITDWREYADIAFWCAIMLLSLTLYLPGAHRAAVALAVGLLTPAGFIWLFVMEQEEGAGIVFGSIILHACIGMTKGLVQHAARIGSPEWWFNQRLSEGRCPRCLYDIRKLPGPRCPECGLDFGEMKPRMHADAHRSIE